MPNTVVLCVSKDLPFAHNRFCAAEGIENVQTASDFKNPEFNEAYAVLMTDGPLAGLMSRAIVAIDAQGKVIYTEQVPEIAQEPDYKKVQEALSK
jgi:thiol peroxidase